MLIGGILLGLVLGLLAGGRLRNLAEIQLRWTGLLVAALVLRFATEAALNAGIDVVEALRLPLLVAAFGVLLIPLWVNRTYPGLSLAFLGVLSNGLVILVNGGYMPIWEPALAYAGLTPADVTRSFHVIVDPNAQDFLGRLLILGDVIPVPISFIQNVYSLGDLFLGLGLAFFLFAGVVRVPTPTEEQQDADLRRRLAADRAIGYRPSGLAPGLEQSASLQRPTVLGADRQRLAGPGATPALVVEAPPTRPISIPGLSPDVLARLRRHPYVRLALNGSFSALWSGQLISLFGDRVHQVAHRSHRLRADGFTDRRRARIRVGDAAEPAVRADRRDARRPLGPPRGPRRQRHPPRSGRVHHADRRHGQHLARLPACLPADDDLDLLPPGAHRHPASPRPRGRAADRQLGVVDRRDLGGCHRLSTGRAVRRRCCRRGVDRVLVRRRDLPRLGTAAQHADPASRPVPRRRRVPDPTATRPGSARNS